MNTPSAKTGTSAPPAARTQSAPASSNAVATEVDVAFIDGKAYPINKNETMLSFMRRHIGPNPVPTLCDAPNLEPFGSCRVCSVEVALQEDGPAKVMASCNSPVGKGMYISTNSLRMERLRKNIIELVLTDYDTERLKKEDHGAMKEKIFAITEMRAYPIPNNSRSRVKDKFGELIESVILDFVNTKLDLYNKLSEQKVKTALKERWFGEFEAVACYDQLFGSTSTRSSGRHAGSGVLYRRRCTISAYACSVCGPQSPSTSSHFKPALI